MTIYLIGCLVAYIENILLLNGATNIVGIKFFEFLGKGI